MCLFLPSVAFAAKAIPYLSGPVIDEVGLLSASEQNEISTYIRSHKELLQMQVWIATLEGESIETLSYRAAKQWALGTEKRDNGVLLLVAPSEKRMRIEVGRGLEGDIPDILAGRILDHILRPDFRQGRFAEGIKKALETCVTLASKGPQAEAAKKALQASPNKRRPSSFAYVVFMLLFFVFSIFGGRRRRHGSIWYGGMGGGGWGSGGGSGWSGGGGSFGGGGSSSSW
ncbi:MAG: TPM domain-containing protein [Bdellovibrionota bacterium]